MAASTPTSRAPDDRPRVPRSLLSDAGLHVVLLQPEIPWNTGNTGRTCLAAGAVLHLVGPLGFSLDDRQVRRAGLDYWTRLAPRVWKDWDDFEPQLAALGAPFFFTADEGAPLWDVRFPERTVLVFGSESAGLPPAIRRAHAPQCVRVPMPGADVRSLNLSTAAGIVLYEVLRQRRG